ncbi:unnamed protein product, partial [Prorocentrum cordatum]
VLKEGMRKSQYDCVNEASPHSNSALAHESSTPNRTLSGFEPGDFCHHDSKAVSATSDANLGSPDSIESQIRLRFHAKEVIAQAVIEHRIAEAANIKPQLHSPETLKQIEKPKTK